LKSLYGFRVIFVDFTAQVSYYVRYRKILMRAGQCRHELELNVISLSVQFN
jgi:hypothetical protein